MTEPTASALLYRACQALTGQSDSPRLDAEILLQAACKIDRTAFARDPEKAISSTQARQLLTLVERRRAGEPIAYILGHKEFWSLDLALNQDTLVPRPETEILVQAVLDATPADSPVDIADLGTGSGAIALALASERPLARIVATDSSRRALAQASNNAMRLNLEVTFKQGDWLAPLQGQAFDIIVSNPPYVCEGDPALERGPSLFEPREALFSGPDGLGAIRQICAGASDCLKPGGLLALEHGHDQQSALDALLLGAGLHAIVHFNDYAGQARVSTARRVPGNNH